MTKRQAELVEQMNEFCDEKLSMDAAVKEAQEYISRNIEIFKLRIMDDWQLNY